jgi:hypothetical protein
VIRLRAGRPTFDFWQGQCCGNGILYISYVSDMENMSRLNGNHVEHERDSIVTSDRIEYMSMTTV